MKIIIEGSAKEIAALILDLSAPHDAIMVMPEGKTTRKQFADMTTEDFAEANKDLEHICPTIPVCTGKVIRE